MKKGCWHFILMLLLVQISVAQTSNDTKKVDSSATDNYTKFRFGGYSEALYQHFDYGANRYSDPAGAPSDNRGAISIPRAVLSFDYKFRKDIILGTEIEVEYGGTGSAMELEYAEAGEYEMEVEKGGEIELEQFHVTKLFFGGKFNLRLGHMIVPVGLTNAHHEPIFFLGTTRPEGEMALLPCTWHETGIALNGFFPKFRYELMLVNGLDPNGFSTANWVGSGRQKIFETSVMTNPALAARVEYAPVKGLRLGASGYYANKTSGNSSKPERMKGVDGRIWIASADAQYLGYGIISRANFIYGDLSDSKEISRLNKAFSRTGYPITPVAEAAMTYSAEVGFDVFHFCERINQKLIPFMRYDYYNTAEKVEEGAANHPRYKRDLLTVGLNYFIIPNLVLKMDYGWRIIDQGNYNTERTFGVSLAYTAWFVKK